MERIEFIISEFQKCNIELSQDKADKLLKLYEFLVEYNQNVNLTAITDFEEVVVKHFIDSVLPFSMIDIKENSSFIDVGTGNKKIALQNLQKCTALGASIGGILPAAEEEKAINYINLAIQMDYEIYEKIIKDPIFFAIKARIQPNLEKTKLEAKMNEKEKKAREHLKNTYILVGRLNNNDIKMMENMRKVSKEKDQWNNNRKNRNL